MIGTSGRLIAESAAAAGRVVDVCDSFADQDCLTAARHTARLAWCADDDPTPEAGAVLGAVAQWRLQHPEGSLVLAAGFEHRPELVAALATQLRLAGTPPAALRACKDPRLLAMHCATCGLATPEVRWPGESPFPGSPGDPWLSKQVGGCGGTHVRPARPDAEPLGSSYWQRRVDGLPVGILFHATGAGILPLSLHTQFCAPTAAQPWRFGGLLASPADPDDAAWQAPLQAAAGQLAARFGLRGLNGLDALWDGQTLWVLEINPRPTAALALLPRAARAAALHAHLGTVPGVAAPQVAGGQTLTAHSATATRNDALNAGMAVVYASARLPIPADFRFPPGCHDLPRLPALLGPGAPVCSMQVSTGGIEKLRSLYGHLRERLLPLAGAEALSPLCTGKAGQAGP